MRSRCHTIWVILSFRLIDGYLFAVCLLGGEAETEGELFGVSSYKDTDSNQSGF